MKLLRACLKIPERGCVVFDQPLYRGEFDLTRVLKKLRSLDYRGSI